MFKIDQPPRRYVRLSVAERREAARLLTAEGLPQRKVASILGVDHGTVSRDLGENAPKRQIKSSDSAGAESDDGANAPNPRAAARRSARSPASSGSVTRPFGATVAQMCQQGMRDARIWRLSKGWLAQMRHPPSHAAAPPPRRSARSPKSGCAPSARPANCCKRWKKTRVRKEIPAAAERPLCGRLMRPHKKALSDLGIGKIQSSRWQRLADRAWPQNRLRRSPARGNAGRLKPRARAFPASSARRSARAGAPGRQVKSGGYVRSPAPRGERRLDRTTPAARKSPPAAADARERRRPRFDTPPRLPRVYGLPRRFSGAPARGGLFSGV
jgi:hypothetical protein